MGRPATEVEFEIIGEIGPADIVKLETQRPRENGVKALRERHHGLARILAAGVPVVDASAMTGYTPERIYMLLRDPSFQELMDFYSTKKENPFLANLRNRMETVALTAADILAERLENEPEMVKTTQVIEIVRHFADRTGFGPSTTTVNVNVGLAKRMDEAKRRMIDVTPKKEDEAA
jgi:hypothetical protein